MKQQKSFSLLFLMFLLTGILSAQNIYVSKSGSNNNDGTSENNALLTIQAAVDKANPGNTILVSQGSYNEKVIFKGNEDSGNAGNYVTLKAISNDVVISGAGLAVSGRQGLVTIQNARYIKIIGFDIKDFQTSNNNQSPVGIYVVGTNSNIEIAENKVHNIKHNSQCSGCAVGAHGIGVFGTTEGGIKNIELHDNEVYDNILQSSEAFVINGNISGFIVKDNYVHDNNNIGFDFIGYEGECGSCPEANDRVRNGLVVGNIAENNSSTNNPWYSGEASAGGFYVDGGTHIIFDRNISTGNDLGFEFASEQQGKKTENIIMSNNLVYKNTQLGVAMGGFNATSTGSAENIAIINNTFYKNDAGWGAEITFQYKVKNTKIANNIIVGSTNVGNNYEGLNNGGNADIEFNKNLWWGNTTSGQNNLPGTTVVSDPRFTNISAIDFTVLSNSPAINAGSTTGSISNWPDPFWEDFYPNGIIPLSGENDLNDNNRIKNTIDLGAYEFALVLVTPPTAPSNLSTSLSGSNNISLIWNDNADNETEYRIERSQDNSNNFEQIDVVMENISTYQDTNLALGTTYYYRIRGYNTAGASVYSNISQVTIPSGNTPLPTPWNNADIGNPVINGNASYSNGAFTIDAGGADIWNNSDEFHFIYQPLKGDGEIIAQTNSIGTTNPWAKGGVMIRETLNSTSKHAMLVASSAEGIAFQRRNVDRGGTTHTGINGAVPVWLKLVRANTTLTAYQSEDGTNWIKIGEDEITMNNDVYIGLALTSHNEAEVCTATFANVLVTNTDISNPIEIIIDGNSSDWANVTAISTQGNGGLTSLKAYDDNDYIYLLAKGTTNTNYIFFLNTDNNTSTGYQNGLWSPEGSDYSIENGELFKYNGSGNNWSWNSQGTSAITAVKTSNSIELKITKSLISNLANSIGIGLDIETSSWNTVATIPTSGVPLAYYTLRSASGNRNAGNIHKTTIVKGSHPNPFTNKMTIDVQTDNPTKVSISIFNIQGEKLKKLKGIPTSSNTYSYNWNGNNKKGVSLPAGIYIAKVIVGKELTTIKIIKN
ncbi:T9SS type A sorting domain-containing protein [Aquimarina algiphila]|uniref:T9SS type A sorting domain-containing protein n=1 Tax=Aquimarina algiphila TaxID=2047982 RepID=A0A554VGZ0_9FLAO|nr:T9SS type A sorting domain-containing protein [Aquimarina algiphila]TSE06704.1 T9SS type A sorting domain-containing protein [Aquimarina algiphila]